jgi:hypothetical protein
VSEGDLGLQALAALGLIGIACGLAMRWVLRRYTDRAALARAKSLVVAHLLEFRLFGDEPGLVLRAQRDVAWQCVRVARLLLVPTAIMALPMLFVFAQLDAVFGKSPIVPGAAAVVTLQWQGGGETPRLEASTGIGVETPAVHAAPQMSWRFRPTQAGPGVLRFTGRNGRVWTKSIAAGTGMSYVSKRRDGFGAGFLLSLTELPLPGGDVEWIEIGYGDALVCGFPWLLWFLLFSGAAIFGRGSR